MPPSLLTSDLAFTTVKANGTATSHTWLTLTRFNADMVADYKTNFSTNTFVQKTVIPQASGPCCRMYQMTNG